MMLRPVSLTVLLAMSVAILALGIAVASRVAIDPGGLPLEIGEVNLLSRHVLDYTFSQAPTDWFGVSGKWMQCTRWTCGPEWSFMGGVSEDDGVAALWNKREFFGDVTVEAYIGFTMDPKWPLQRYKHPSDLNIIIHGDGANVAGGYNFMIGADGNTESRIMKGEKALASSSETEALLPIVEDKWPGWGTGFHTRWWSVRARKAGSKLQLYLDEKLAVEVEDPEPLTAGRVAIWGYRNGLSISRVKVYYQAAR